MRRYRRKRVYRRKRTYKVKARRTYRKKRYTKKKKGVMPFRMTTTMKFCREITLDPGEGGSATSIFRTNSVFDPDGAGTTHQPYGYDQLAFMYENWRVNKSSIKVKQIPEAVQDKIPMYLTVYPSIYSAAQSYNSNDHFLEWCANQKIPVSSVGSFGSALNAHGRQWDASCGWNARRSDATREIPSDNWGTYGADPEHLEYFHVVGRSMHGNDPQIMTVRVEITYNVTFFKPNFLPEST